MKLSNRSSKLSERNYNNETISGGLWLNVFFKCLNLLDT